MAIAVFIHDNHYQSATSIIVPKAEILGAVMLLGSLATVAAIAVRAWTGYAPYVLGATSGVLILFIAIVGEPAAEQLKPIPPLAAAIDAQRTPDSTIAIRGAAGSYALIFYTAPIVLNVDETDDAAFVKTLCAERDLFLVTRAVDLPVIMQLTAVHGRRATELRRVRGVTAVHIDGPPCRAGSGAST